MRVLHQATEEEGRAAGSSAALPRESVRSGSAPVASLLVPVTMREQGLSSKMLAIEKEVEDHEVAVLKLERQVSVLLELGENFERLSDLVNETETEALESEQHMAVVELEDNFKQLSAQLAELEHSSKLESKNASEMVKEADCLADSHMFDVWRGGAVWR